MFALYKKEIAAFLNSLIAYLVIGAFLLINGLFLWVFPTEFNILNFAYSSLDSFFSLAPTVFLFLIPAITMRMFAEEKKTGTIELLFTRPLSDWQIIGAKYWAAFSLVVLSLIPSLIYVLSVYWLSFPYGNLDLGVVWGSYLGLLFLAAAFISIGIFASAISDNQIVAFVIGILLSAFAFLGFEIIYALDIFGSFDLFVRLLGIQVHYLSIQRGVVDLRDVVYFISLSALFLLFTHTFLSSRKW
ncbi:MAG: gliding motility-associated ABC transporter permease subunit GldF [Bacteroidales bacterium]|nr:gliding motility-associated ABC transporter permease subunit GldF [Bacteroidales bacterium]